MTSRSRKSCSRPCQGKLRLRSGPSKGRCISKHTSRGKSVLASRKKSRENSKVNEPCENQHFFRVKSGPLKGRCISKHSKRGKSILKSRQYRSRGKSYFDSVQNYNPVVMESEQYPSFKASEFDTTYEDPFVNSVGQVEIKESPQVGFAQKMLRVDTEAPPNNDNLPVIHYAEGDKTMYSM